MLRQASRWHLRPGKGVGRGHVHLDIKGEHRNPVAFENGRGHASVSISKASIAAPRGVSMRGSGRVVDDPARSVHHTPPPPEMPRSGASERGLRLPPEMVRLARSIDSNGAPGGGEPAQPGEDMSVVIGRVENRGVYELACYVRACMMRTGFA